MRQFALKAISSAVRGHREVGMADEPGGTVIPSVADAPEAQSPSSPAASPPRAGLPRPADDRPAQRQQPSARTADLRPPRDPPQGRPGDPAAARLRGGRGQARRSVAPLRRPVHHPSAGGGQHPGRAGHGHHHAGGRAAARHRRGHRLHPGGADRRVRRGGRPSRRRRHQTRQRSSSAARPRARPSAR